jgi:hypothetical protein
MPKATIQRARGRFGIFDRLQMWRLLEPREYLVDHDADIPIYRQQACHSLGMVRRRRPKIRGA